MTPTRVTVSRAPTPGPTSLPIIRVAEFKTARDLGGPLIRIDDNITVAASQENALNAIFAIVLVGTLAMGVYFAGRDQSGMD